MRSALPVLLLLLICGPALADDVVGRASVIDGDTIDIHGTRIRLYGIDAPEAGQTCRDGNGTAYNCGQKAANELAAFLDGRTVSCVPQKRDQYGRTVAACAVDDTDLGDWLVRRGLAIDYAYFSKGKYRAAQDEASKAHTGVWAGPFVEPRQYRVCMKDGGRPAACSIAPVETLPR